MRHFQLSLWPKIAIFLMLSFSLAGCASNEEVKDETRDWSVEKLFNTAHEAMVDKKYERAIELYFKVEARFPFGIYAQQALLETIYSHFQLAETSMVIATSASFIKQYPNHPAIDYVYYIQGLSNFQEDSGIIAWLAKSTPTERDPKATLEAYLSFKTLKEKFPQSPYAKDVVGRMNYLLEVLSAYEVNVGKLYFDYGAYVASASRMVNALQEYPLSTQQENQLVLLARSYEALGITELQHDTIRVLQKNFPKNPLVAEYLAAIKNKPIAPKTAPKAESKVTPKAPGVKPAAPTKPATPAKPVVQSSLSSNSITSNLMNATIQ